MARRQAHLDIQMTIDGRHCDIEGTSRVEQIAVGVVLRQLVLEDRALLQWDWQTLDVDNELCIHDAPPLHCNQIVTAEAKVAIFPIDVEICIQVTLPDKIVQVFLE